MTIVGSQRPRVLMLTQRFPYPPNRGDRIRAYNLLRFLCEHYQVSLAASSDEPVSPTDFKHVADLCREIYVAPITRMGRLWHLACSFASGQSLSEGYFYSPSLSRTIVDWHRQQPFDVAVVFCSSMFRYVELSALKDCPRVIDLVDVDSLKWEQMSQSHRSPRKWVYAWEASRVRRLEKRILTHSSAIALVSQAEADLFCTRVHCSLRPSASGTPGTATVDGISNGVDTSYFMPPSDSLSRVDNATIQLVFTGVLNYSPNVEGIAWFCHEVLPLLNERLSRPIELKIVGRNPIERVRELGSLERVDVVGEVPDVRPYLDNADIAISPLHLARGIQNKVLEAMAAGLPVVVTPQSAEGINAKDDVHLFIAADKQAFADRLEQLANDAHLRQRTGHAAREFVVAHFSWASKLSRFKVLVDAAAGRQ